AGPDTVRALRGPGRQPLAGRIGAIVSLVPVGTVAGVRTEGLAYPLAGETLELGRARGVSNEIVAAPAAVSCDAGVLLVIERRADA
ncbi:MAG: thiamine diphosphokinase, partial [Candidatus Rokubacteria bacterium]|nr:thiamine diphosphokinase [Candidatus Rokubacteria bacterium]